WRVTSAATDVHAVEDALVTAGIAVESADTTMLPTSTVPLETPEAAKQVLRVIDALEEDDDVQDVYANFDIPDSVMEELAG
ncbi:MAG: YebC/PmpR family DNA-binding transcriptional regulator, partial [Acidimicrobiales bacterium]